MRNVHAEGAWGSAEDRVMGAIPYLIGTAAIAMIAVPECYANALLRDSKDHDQVCSVAPGGMPPMGEDEWVRGLILVVARARGVW
jgi:hypothetical protein